MVSCTPGLAGDLGLIAQRRLATQAALDLYSAPKRTQQTVDMVMQGGGQNLGDRLFAGPGEVRQRCRELDWSKTPLGPLAGWSPCLISAVRQVLAQPLPSALYWGAQQVLVYNDGLRALLGDHHPASLGRPAREIAADGWGLREPVHTRVLAGESLVFEDEPHVLQRAGERLDAWFTVAFCPLSDGAGNVAGVLATAHDTTARVRSVAALHESRDREAYLPMLSDALRDIPDAAGITSRAERILKDRLVADLVACTELEQRGSAWADGASETDARLDVGSARAFDLFPTLAATVPYGIGLVEGDVVRSTRLSAAERAALRERRIGAVVVLPLMRNGKLRATTLVVSERARRWSEHELVLIGETAECTCAAVDRARDNVSLRRSEARQSFMVQLVDALRALTDPRQIESEAVALIAARLGADAAYYIEVDGQRQQLAVWQAAGACEPLHRLGSFALAPWAGLVAALRTGEPFVIDDMNVTTRIRALLRDTLTGAGARATLTVPILQRGQLLAALCLVQRQARCWGGDEIALLVEATERSWAAIDRARVEQARRTSEQKYRTLFDSIDEGVAMLELVLDGAGSCRGYDLLEHNLALGRLLGGPAAPEGLPGLETRRLEQVMRTGDSARFEQAVPEQGRWLELKVSRVGGQGSRFLVVVYTDISDHKGSEQVLRDSEARQRFLLGLSDLLRPLAAPAEIEELVARTLGEHLAADRTYYVTCPEGTGTALIHRDYARPPLRSLAGSYPLADFPWMVETTSTGRTLVLGDVPGEGAVSASEQQQLEALGLGAVIITPILRSARLAGALVVASLTPRRWAPAEVSLAEEVGTRTWVALEHRRIEAAYRASEARFRAFVEYVREYAIFLVDKLGRITEWTAGAERVTGYAAADVLGRHLSLLCSAEDVAHDEPAAALREAELLGRAERETWRVRKDGRRYWVNEVATAVRDEVGKLVGFTIICRDQSEPRRSREQREGLLAAATAAHEEAERANLATDEFLGTLGHELRTPLAAILLWGAALRSGAVADADTGRAVDAILQSAKTQSRLVDDLLDLSRLRAGKLLLSPAPVAVDAIAHAACDMVEPMARGKQVGLALFLGDDLGRGVFDAARLQQVLWNLLTNAIKFTPEGGRVTLRVSRSDTMLEIEVADTGQGIAPEFMPHVFERFRQADMGQTREHGGLGIGLALCRYLVELQRGSIEAHSEGLGQGSVFRVRLPWQDLGAALEEPEDQAPPSRPARLRGVRVLLVEDDCNTREVMAWTLNNAGARVVAVETGAEALSQLHAGHADRAGDDFDVIISDLGLPEMSGHDLIERAARLRQAHGQAPLPACAVSAHVRDTDRQRAIDAGYDLYLAKPITPEQLIEAVEDLRDVAAEPRLMARIS